MKRTILAVVAVLFVLSLLAYSAYVYEYYRQPTPTISTEQAVKERNKAQQQLALHDAVAKRVQDELSKQVTDTQTKLTAVCTSLKTVSKVANVNCP